MQIRFNKIILFLLVAVTAFVINITMTKANDIVCDYEDYSLKIIYKNGATPTFELVQPFKTNNALLNAMLEEWNKNPNVQIETDFDETLYDTLVENEACPTGFHIGLITRVNGDGVAFTSDKIQSKYLYIVPDGVYIEKYRKYVSGVVDDSGYKNAYNAGSEACNYSNTSNISKLLSYGCGAANVGVEFFKYYAGNRTKAFANLLVDGDEKIYDGDTFWYSKVSVIDSGAIIYKGEYKSLNTDCPTLSISLYEYKDYIKHYERCDNASCRKTYKQTISEYETNLKDQCRTILKEFNYVGQQAECINDCMNINKSINDAKKGTSLEITQAKKCGFSEKLFIWIRNIYNWIKYIVPILLIVLSILDFLKAMASEKDDEMVKARKHFVIRLVAVALIFLIPSLIEFIFIKMGFVYEGCGVI